MPDGLAPLGPWALASILAKAAGYAAALLAMGGVTFLAVFRAELAAGAAGAALVRDLRRLTAAAAAAGLLVLALRFGIRAARLSGIGVPGMADPVMLGIVGDGPLGDAAVWRAAGLALILLVLAPGRGSAAASLLGALAVTVSYTRVGHSLGEPRWALGALLAVHLLAAAFWVGALWPLRRAAGSPGAAALLHRFGVLAAGAVGLLVAAGASFAWLVTGDLGALPGTAYGWTLMAKLALVAALLGLAALNKLRLTPALVRGDPGAPAKLRRSIGWEMALVALILLATAALTTITTPPARP